VENRILEISWGTILKVVVAFFCFYLVYLIKDILILTVFGLVISILFEAPLRLVEKRIPRALAVILLYLFVFSSLCFLIYLPASRIVSEIGQFIKLFPLYFEQISPPLRELGLEAFNDIENFVNALEEVVRVMTTNILNVLFSIFGGIVSTIFVISIAIFLSLEGRSVEKGLGLLFSEEEKKFAHSLWRRCQRNVGFWFLRLALGCLFVGIISYIAFLVLRANYPLSLALMAGALNFIPIIGPVLASFVMFIVLALDSMPKAFLAVIIYTIVQQIENNILTPFLTKRFTGLSPTLVLISLAAGGQLFGILGAILTVPLVGIVVEFAKGLLERRKEMA